MVSPSLQDWLCSEERRAEAREMNGQTFAPRDA